MVHDDDEWPIISRYTRAQAIADGVLVDVTPLAKEAGFVLPVALTAAVHASCVAVPEGVEAQDETGRLWDLLKVLRARIRAAPAGAHELRFQVEVRNRTAEVHALRALIGPGDAAEPVLTVLLPDED